MMVTGPFHHQRCLIRFGWMERADVVVKAKKRDIEAREVMKSTVYFRALH